MKYISFIGLPGSGKGTQSNLLTENFNFISISPGNALRKKNTIDSLVVVDSKTITKLLNEEIKLSIKERINIGYLKDGFIKDKNLDQNSTIIFDGFPRIIDQIDLFEIDVAIYLKSNEGVVTKILLNRNIDKDDDKLDIIRDRTKQFYDLTILVVSEFRKRGLLIEVDANRPKEEVFEDISTKLEAFRFVRIIK